MTKQCKGYVYVTNNGDIVLYTGYVDFLIGISEIKSIEGYLYLRLNPIMPFLEKTCSFEEVIKIMLEKNISIYDYIEITKELKETKNNLGKFNIISTNDEYSKNYYFEKEYKLSDIINNNNSSNNNNNMSVKNIGKSNINNSSFNLLERELLNQIIKCEIAIDFKKNDKQNDFKLSEESDEDNLKDLIFDFGKYKSKLQYYEVELSSKVKKVVSAGDILNMTRVSKRYGNIISQKKIIKEEYIKVYSYND